ncbi:beta-1,3-glucanase family protein [Roseibium marinum]|uniref:Beta-1,3-glucanase n=1 Tax=Roseibium marinum TaxID=281252 RepID=A0A2S3UK50_9HYPH|nr:beta-1,3-glucanase family protein [Roseibium marinum]POF27960.1 beta-1,3-glucanase [Roseibium marinum]
MISTVLKRLFFGGLITLAPCLANADTATATLTVTSQYPITVTIGSDAPCKVTASSPCTRTDLPTGGLGLTFDVTEGTILQGGTLACLSIEPGIGTVGTSISVVAGANNCALTVKPAFDVTASGAGLIALTVGTGANSHPCYQLGTSLPQTWECPYSGERETLTLTPGLASGIFLGSGQGACADASAAGFSVTVTPTGFSCILSTGSQQPDNGWWIMAGQNSSYLALQRNATHSESMLGMFFTQDPSGAAVWYMLNAYWNDQTAAFTGTASTYSAAPALPAGFDTMAAPRVDEIVADVTLSFSESGSGNLVWTSRADGMSETLALTRPHNRAQGQPSHAPATGWYGANVSTSPLVLGGTGIFLEMWGTDNAPEALMGVYWYEPMTGKPMWWISDQAGTTVTPYPATGTQTGWTMATHFDSGSNFFAGFGDDRTSNTYGVFHLLPSQVELAGEAGPIVATFDPYAAWGDTAHGYWVSLGSEDTGLADPYVTFFPGSNSAGQLRYVPTSGNNANSLIDFPSTTPVKLSDIASAALFASNQTVGGDLYFSEQPLEMKVSNICTPITATQSQAPSPVSITDCNYKTRWQFIELGGVFDVTYINLYSIPVAINQGASRYGEPLAGASLSGLSENLAALAGGNSSSVTVKSTAGETVRVISPANGNTWSGYYPGFAGYLSSAFNEQTGTPTVPISVSNTYESAARKPESTVCSAAAFDTQTYSTSSVTYQSSGATQGALTITGSAQTVHDFTITAYTPVTPRPTSCSGSTGAAGTCYTSGLTPGAFSNAIYEAVVYYSVNNPACTSGQIESNGSNDVFSAVVRDVLVGLASGFVDSSEASPAGLPAANSTYGTMTSAQWSADAAKLFHQVQSSAYYNTWAAEIRDTFGSGVYGFQYSDFFAKDGPIGNPQLPLVPMVPVGVKILDSSK